jgi:hypothetical protein
MSNFVYGKAKESFLKGEINLLNNNIKVLIIDSSEYSASQNSDQYVSDIPVAAIKHRSTALQTKSITLGVFDADDILIPEYSGDAFDAMVIYQDNSNDSLSRLLFHIDNAVGLPFTGSISTSPVTIVWDNSGTRIISI